MPIITGQTGPFQGVPGAHGGNASFNVLQKQANKAGIAELALSTVQITPGSSFQAGQLAKEGLDDYFRYAENDIAQFDTNGDAFLSRDEVVKNVFAGDEPIADQFYRAIDQDGKPDISAVDMTAYLMAQDGPKQLFANLKLGNLFHSAQRKYQTICRREFPGESLPAMAFDGQATAAERHVLDRMIQNAGLNVTVGNGLQELQRKLNLADRYEGFKASR